MLVAQGCGSSAEGYELRADSRSTESPAAASAVATPNAATVVVDSSSDVAVAIPTGVPQDTPVQATVTHLDEQQRAKDPKGTEQEEQRLDVELHSGLQERSLIGNSDRKRAVDGSLCVLRVPVGSLSD
jgi:hypothetical protein